MNLVDAGTASTLATYEYGPFGNTLVASGPLADTNPIRFSSKYFEGAQPPGSPTQPSALSPQPALYYYGYRYYSPAIGRWVSRDAGVSPYSCILAVSLPCSLKLLFGQHLLTCTEQDGLAGLPVFGALFGKR